jgi:hypothetical protein
MHGHVLYGTPAFIQHAETTFPPPSPSPSSNLTTWCIVARLLSYVVHHHFGVDRGGYVEILHATANPAGVVKSHFLCILGVNIGDRAVNVSRGPSTGDPQGPPEFACWHALRLVQWPIGF